MIATALFLPVLIVALWAIDRHYRLERLTRELRAKQKAARRKHAVYLATFRNQ